MPFCSPWRRKKQTRCRGSPPHRWHLILGWARPGCGPELATGYPAMPQLAVALLPAQLHWGAKPLPTVMLPGGAKGVWRQQKGGFDPPSTRNLAWGHLGMELLRFFLPVRTNIWAQCGIKLKESWRAGMRGEWWVSVGEQISLVHKHWPLVWREHWRPHPYINTLKDTCTRVCLPHGTLPPWLETVSVGFPHSCLLALKYGILCTL